MTSSKKDLELVRHSNDLCLGGVLMHRAYCAVKSGDRENGLEQFLENGMLSIWASAQVRECSGEVEQEDEGRQGIVQDILGGGTRTSCGRPLHQSTKWRGHLVVCVSSLSLRPA